jgi:hypothetical protein
VFKRKSVIYYRDIESKIERVVISIKAFDKVLQEKVSTSVIIKALIDKIVIDGEKNKHSETTLKWIAGFKLFAQSYDIPFDFIIAFSKGFESAFSEKDARSIQIKLPGNPHTEKLENVIALLQGTQNNISTGLDVFYIYCRKEKKVIDTTDIIDFLDQLHDIVNKNEIEKPLGFLLPLFEVHGMDSLLEILKIDN